MNQKQEVIGGVMKEIVQRAGFFGKEYELQTIYFGGGTPSVLDANELGGILDKIHDNYNVSENVEITFECNPDDLDADYLKMLKNVGVNRLSIGIQSFNDDHLKWMNRSHTAEQSISCVHLAANQGFADITIDLIYGLPMLTKTEWQQTVLQALALPINHLSAYSLTLEENTPYQKLVGQKKYKKPNEDMSAIHYHTLCNEVEKAKWQQYEVSNFCKTKNYSKHNTAYWQNKKYLGVGPSAHSFDGKFRYWNVRSNSEYVKLQAVDKKTYEKEELSITNQINEKLLTGLRTIWGVSLNEIESDLGYDIKRTYKKELDYWHSLGWLRSCNDQLVLSNKGLLFADYLASELFLLEDDYSSHIVS